VLVEPTGALAASLALRGGMSFRGARVGIIVSGGNIDLADLGRHLLDAAGRPLLQAEPGATET